MTLARKLDAIRAGFEAQADEATLKTMHGATAALVASGQADRALGEGEKVPDFELANLAGETVALASLRARGPVVLTVFRGHW